MTSGPNLWMQVGEYYCQCQRARESSSCRCLCTGASVLAVIMPLAAAAGTPIPGAHESPHLTEKDLCIFKITLMRSHRTAWTYIYRFRRAPATALPVTHSRALKRLLA